MTSTTRIAITEHTTASTPRPHILYTINVNRNGTRSEVQRRYSEFIQLHEVLKDPFTLPPKRLLVTTFLPSAWADDAIIAERKAGLAAYLSALASSPLYNDHSSLYRFLFGDELPGSSPRNTDGTVSRDGFDLEDALPSTMPRKAALMMATMVANGQATGLRPTGADVMSVAAASAGPSENTALAMSASTKSGEATFGVAAADSGMHYAAYYPGWSASTFPPEKIDFSKFDIIYFAFAMPNSSSGLTWEGSDKDVLRRLVAAAKKSGKGTKIVLSIGGWGGCYWFSQACSTASNRTKLVNALMDAVKTYQLDGIDLDWEYPNSPGAGNPHSANDAANLLALMKSLRISLGTCAILAAAVSHMPWLGSNGKPLTDVTDFAAVMSFINIMNYDVWGASGTPGPNAPMGNLCGTSKQPQASAQAAVSQWKAAGFPANKQSMGMALYGWVSKSTKTVLTGASVATANFLILAKVDGKSDEDASFLNGAHPRFKEDGTSAQSSSKSAATAQGAVSAAFADTATNGEEAVRKGRVENDGEVMVSAAASVNLAKWHGQQIPFKTLVSSGALAKKSDGTYGGSGGFTMGWDNCSNTPYLFNTAQTTVVSYDDTWSLNDKAKFCKSSGLAGCFSWSMDQDDGYTLQNVIRKAIGKN